MSTIILSPGCHVSTSPPQLLELLPPAPLPSRPREGRSNNNNSKRLETGKSPGKQPQAKQQHQQQHWTEMKTTIKRHQQFWTAQGRIQRWSLAARLVWQLQPLLPWTKQLPALSRAPRRRRTTGCLTPCFSPPSRAGVPRERSLCWPTAGFYSHILWPHFDLIRATLTTVILEGWKTRQNNIFLSKNNSHSYILRYLTYIHFVCNIFSKHQLQISISTF